MKHSGAAVVILAASGTVFGHPRPRDEWPVKPHPPRKAYTLQAMRSLDDEIQLKYLQARDRSIRLGGKPTVYCPPSSNGCLETQGGRDGENAVTAFLLDESTGRAQLVSVLN